MPTTVSANPAFQKYAGKIINIAELETTQYPQTLQGLTQRFKDALGLPARAFKSLLGEKSPEATASKTYGDWPQFFITLEGQIDKVKHGKASAENTYVEASTLLSFLSAAADKQELTASFMEAIEKAPDHRALAQDGKLNHVQDFNIETKNLRLRLSV